MFSTFLLNYRIKHGLSQSDLAEKLSVSQNTISQYESGKRTPRTKQLSHIAEILGCSVADIIGKEG